MWNENILLLIGIWHIGHIIIVIVIRYRLSRLIEKRIY